MSIIGITITQVLIFVMALIIYLYYRSGDNTVEQYIIDEAVTETLVFITILPTVFYIVIGVIENIIFLTILGVECLLLCIEAISLFYSKWGKIR